MTDPGAFEILASRVLRFLHEDCKSLAHLGTNAEGKTKVSPVDGFQLIPHSQPHRYVMTAYTVGRDLKRKWLFDAGDVPGPEKAKMGEDGDLVKAGKLAKTIRSDDTDARFTLYLCTNHALNLDLMQNVYSAANRFQISVQFLEQSQIRDFLDPTADGQWLRQEHLGIKADRLSYGLLHHLSDKSLQAYRFDTQIVSSQIVIPTAADGALASALVNPAVSILFLAGPSGSGKSVLARTALERHVQAGGVGIRITGEVADRSIGLHDALSETLRSLHGPLDLDAGRAALGFGSAERPFLIIIDDVNRTPYPSRVLDKIISWARPVSVGQSEELQYHVRIICPIWEARSLALEPRHNNTNWIRFQTVRSFSRRESVDFLERAFDGSALMLGRQKLGKLAAALRDDPILLGLFADILLGDRVAEAEAIAEDVIGRYVKTSLAEVAVENGDLTGEYSAALDSVARELIQRKNLYPRWEELRGWFPVESQIPGLLKKINTSGKICRILETNDVERFAFRHDRILEHFLAEAMRKILLGADDSMELQDPYFVPYLGRAVAQSDLSAPKLDWILENNPVALIASLQFLSDVPTARTSEIIRRAQAWLTSAAKQSEARRRDALFLLVEMSSAHVLSVTKGVAGDSLVWEAQLRNGDALAGAQALSLEFYPRVRHAWLESLIQEAKENHGPSLIATVKELLGSKETVGNLLNGALCLAGYLGDAVLADSITEAWKRTSQDDESLVCFLWAGLRCGSDDPQRVLDPMMQKLLAVDDTESPSRLSPRSHIEEALSFSARHGFADSVFRYLADLGENEEYSAIIMSVVGRVDHSVAVGYMVRRISRVLSELKPGYFSPLASQWREGWRQRSGNESDGLSESSLRELYSIWTNPTSPQWLQDYAFQVWALYTDDLPALRKVDLTGHLGDTAVRNRALKGDMEIAEVLKERIAGDDKNRYWLQFVRYVWRADFEETLDKLLFAASSGSDDKKGIWTNDYFALAHALRDIPSEPAERLLSKHWSKLSCIPVFIQTALYLSTSDSRARAAETLEHRGRRGEAFEFLDSFFGFKISGLHDRLSIKHLESILPYIEEIDEMVLYHMVEWCHRSNLRSWAVEYLEPECIRRSNQTEQSQRKRPSMLARTNGRWFRTDSDILEEFTTAEQWDANHRLFHMEHLFDDLMELGESPTRIFELLEKWVSYAPSQSRRDVALAALQVRGTRSDVSRIVSCFRATGLAQEDGAIEDVSYIVRRKTLE